MVLADTSVWIHHFRHDLPELRAALDDGSVVVHPFVIGALACGTLRRRREILEDLAELPAVDVAEHGEVLAMVEGRRLAGSGIGWLDAHLLASARIARVRLWTLDRALAAAWRAISER